jgi:hypothetical protein
MSRKINNFKNIRSNFFAICFNQKSCAEQSRDGLYKEHFSSSAQQFDFVHQVVKSKK